MFDDLIRFFAAFMIGHILSACGSFSQLLSSNVLASPSTLGIQALSLLAIIISFFISMFFSFEDYISVSFLVFFIFFLAWIFTIRKSNKERSYFSKMILAGIGINLLVAAIYSFVQFLMINLGMSFPSELLFGSVKFLSNNEFYISFFCNIFSLLNLFS